MAVEIANWISVGELAESFAADPNLLTPSRELAGQRLELHDESGAGTVIDFVSPEKLRWAGPLTAGEEEESYRATSIRAGIHFVDFVATGAKAGTSVTLVLDLARKVATSIIGRLPDADAAHGDLLARAQRREELTVVETEFRAATIGKAHDPSLAHHAPTRELIGLRIQHRYSPHELYEHIYLNEKRYAWHCIAGAEAGLSDGDRCHYYRIDTDLFLFVWREKVVPTLGVCLIDLAALKTTGKIFGYADDAMTKLVNFPTGARSTVLNRTIYAR
jgi:hypothetical protein